MSSYHESSSKDPFFVSTTNPPSSATNFSLVNPTRSPLPEGWRRLSTGLRGVRLYRVTPVTGGGDYWVAAMTLDGKELERRFASELHARAWLTVRADPRSPVTAVDLEQVHGPFRMACVAAAGNASAISRVG